MTKCFAMYKFGLLPLVLMTLISCKMDTSIDLYLGDVDEAMSKSNTIFTSGILSVNITSQDECIKNKDRILNIVSKHVDVVEIQGCHDRDLDSYLDFSVRYPVSTNLTNDLIQLQLIQLENNIVDVQYVLNRRKFNSLNAEVSREFSSDIDLEDSTILLNVINDLRSNKLVFVNAAFVNGMPAVNDTREIRRRDRLKIRFSDVHSSSVSIKDRVDLVQIANMN